jgi:hypothetical protein
VLDVVSRKWLSTLLLAEETSTQIEAAFTAALDEEGLAERIDARLLARLRAGELSPGQIDGPEADGVPVLIAMSVNRPQMRSHSTKEFMAACAIMQRFGRPGTSTDQAWIESLFGHVKTDWPHLEKTRDPARSPRTRPRPRRVQHRAPAPRHRLRHPRRRTPRPRRRHPPSSPPRAGPNATSPHRVPSNEHKEPIMIARRPRLGICQPTTELSQKHLRSRWRTHLARPPSRLADVHDRVVLDVGANLVAAHSENESAAATFKGGFGYRRLAPSSLACRFRSSTRAYARCPSSTNASWPTAVLVTTAW